MRELKGARGVVANSLLVLVVLLFISFSLDIPRYLGFKPPFEQQYLALFLGLVLASVFLRYPPRKQRATGPLPWYDAVLAASGFVASTYLAVAYPGMLWRPTTPTPLDLAFGIITLITLAEAVRRLFGWIPVGLLALFATYALYSHRFPGFLEGKPHSWSQVVSTFYFGDSGILGFALAVAFGTVFAFIMFGQGLLTTGGGQLFTDIALATVGRFRGGPAKAVLAADLPFGSTSGSAVANIVTTGVVTIPLMKNVGYRPEFAGGVEAISSIGGQVVPPVMGATAFIIAQFLGLPYYQVMLAAALPAIIYYACLFFQIDLESAKVGLRGIPAHQLPSVKPALKFSWVYFLPLLLLIIFLSVLYFREAKAGLFALGTLLLLGMVRPASRLGPKGLLLLLRNTGQAMLDIGVVSAMVGIIIGSVMLTGLGLSFSQVLTSLSGGNTILLLILAAAASIILGTSLPTVACYILLAVLVAPALVGGGLYPLGVHMFLFYFGILSFITPPVCIGAYVAASLAGANPMRTAWQSIKLGIVAFIMPFFFVLSPGLLLKGSATDIVFSFGVALLIAWVLAVAAEGYLFRKVNWAGRALCATGALLLFINSWETRAAGLVLVALWHLWEWRRAKQSAPQPIGVSTGKVQELGDG